MAKLTIQLNEHVLNIKWKSVVVFFNHFVTEQPSNV